MPACTGLLPCSLVVGDSERLSSPLSLVTQCSPSLADGPNVKSRSRRRACDERSFRGNRRARAGEGAGRAIQAGSGSRSKLVAGPSENKRGASEGAGGRAVDEARAWSAREEARERGQGGASARRRLRTCLTGPRAESSARKRERARHKLGRSRAISEVACARREVRMRGPEPAAARRAREESGDRGRASAQL